MKRAAVTQSELARALKAARNAGYERCDVEYENSTGTRVRVIARTTDDADADVADDFDFDEQIGRLPDAEA